MIIYNFTKRINLTKPGFVRFRLMSLLSLLSLFFSLPVYAQITPQFLFTWRANNLTPSFYEGKNLPTKGTVMNIRFELIDGGRVADLSRNEIRWFIDRKKVSSGLGKKNLAMRITNSNGFDHDIKIQIVDYRGNTLERVLVLPINKPQITIDAPFVDNRIFSGSINLTAWPYFFTEIIDIKDLFWTWSANNEKTKGTTEKPNILEILVPSVSNNQNVDIEVIAENPLNRLEVESKNTQLTIIP